VFCRQLLGRTKTEKLEDRERKKGYRAKGKGKKGQG